ncbi:hypothetical protein ACHHYP_13293 [Achlya hypogyna]|uniref:Uncharacterized protein n=1 Tax=Achlya hypogyna TaxID=1202772 RepID=A0A1V9YFM6_ACHHY|nr:hypothetical protein ACHHYP_13293 [Achlya hypogyna]
MKSSCQLRLEQRSHDEGAPVDATEKLQAMWDRISEARRKRRQQLSERRITAQNHVSKAISVARTVHLEAQARADDQLSRIQSRLEAAEQRRLERLQQTSTQCQQRNEHIMSTLQQQANRLIEKRRLYDASLHAAHHRRAQLTTAYVSKLRVEQHKRERVHARRSKAATQLQTWFRSWKQTRQAYRVALPLVPALSTVLASWEQIGKEPFEKSMELVQQRKTAAAAHSLVKALSPTPISYRVFLMAGMFTHHSKETMENGRYCAPLARAASLLSSELKTLHAALKVRSLLTFDASWKRWEAYCLNYEALFNSWRANDAAQLDADMLMIYSEVYAVHLTAARTGAMEIHTKSQTQLTQLRASMEQSFGLSVAAKKIAKVEADVEAHLQRKDPLPTKKAETPPSSPIRKPLSKPDLSFTKEVFANDALAHELILNPDYQIPSLELAPPSLHATVACTMRRAFWDQLRGDRNRIVGTFVELRDQLSSVLKHKALAAALPNAHLEALAAPTVAWADWAAVLELLLRAILAGEAPARNDSTTAHLATVAGIAPPSTEAAIVDALVNFLEFAFAKVDEIHIDSMNAHLKALGPYVARHGVEHEQKKFALKLESGIVTLAHTEQWLRSHVAAAPTPLRSELAAGNRAAFRTVLHTAFVALVSEHVAGDSMWPETFALDKDRVRGLRNQVDLLAMQASLITILQGSVAPRRYSAADAAAFCSQIAILTEASDTRVGDLAVHTAAEAARLVPSVDRAAVMRRVEHTLDPSDAVFALFFKRVLQTLSTYLRSNALEIHPTLEVLRAQLTALVQTAAKLARHNEAVHVHYYNRLIREAMELKQ